MYDRPPASVLTLSESTSIPTTENPALANSTASGRPTYPRPITPPGAGLLSLFLGVGPRAGRKRAKKKNKKKTPTRTKKTKPKTPATATFNLIRGPTGFDGSTAAL